MNIPKDGDTVLYTGLKYIVLQTWQYTPTGELILSLQSLEGFNYLVVPISRFFELEGEIW